MAKFRVILNKIMEEILETLVETFQDETKRIVVIGLSIIVVSLFMIYKNRRSQSSLRPPITINAIREAEKKIITDLAGAVGDMKEFVLPQKPQRFRKRDRVWFFGRRLMRRVGDNIKYVEDMGMRSKKSSQQMLKSMFLGDSSSESSSVGDYAERRPAEDWLEEESVQLGGGWVPPELKYLLNSFHMFGQFDPALFAELYPSIESLRVTAGQFLFRIGDPDRFIFVVQSGQLDVTCTDTVGRSLLKRVGAGESLTSVLSFIDVLTGHANPFKTIQAQARVDSVVLRLSMNAFQPIFDKNPELLIRVVQIVMARVQRVIFVGLHSYLGISTELIRPYEADQLESPAGPSPTPLSLEMELQLAARNQSALNLMEGVRGIQKELNISDISYLKTVVQIREYEAGDEVLREAAHSDIALGYIIEGLVTMYVDDHERGAEDKLYSADKGECFGQVAMLTGEANFYTCRASKRSVLALLSKSSFVSIITESPASVLSLAHSTLSRLSPLVRKIDFALGWETVEAGHSVTNIRQTDLKTLLVLSGRLRGYTVKSGQRQLSGEYGRGDMVGLVDVITGKKQGKQYLSVRDSEVCIIPGELLEFLKSRSNVVMAKIISVLGNRLISGEKGLGISETNQVKYTSVAVFGNTTNVPVLQFCYELEMSFTSMGTVSRLSSKIVQKKLGKSCLKKNQEYRLNSWLGQQEDRHSCVIYQCDPTATEWTKKCLRHADIVLVLALASDTAEITESEKELETHARRIRKELVLLWSSETDHPTGTRDWLKRRPWLSSHLHVKMPERMTRHQTEGKIKRQYSALAGTPPDLHSDFTRICRCLQGQSIGLVLGGGGARGAAHLGMLQSILEAGIPVDKVGGVSIGAFVGGLWSLHRDFDKVKDKSKEWFNYMITYANYVLDLTYPITSLFTGASFNFSIKLCFPETVNIEDLWLPYYNVSTDISTSTERVHKVLSVVSHYSLYVHYFQSSWV